MKIYSVEYINHYIKDLVNNEFKYPIAIKGEMNDLINQMQDIIILRSVQVMQVSVVLFL